MNILVLILFAFLLIASCFLAMGDQLWQRSHLQGAWYLEFNGEWPDLGVGFSGWVIQVTYLEGSCWGCDDAGMDDACCCCCCCCLWWCFCSLQNWLHKV